MQPGNAREALCAGDRESAARLRYFITSLHTPEVLRYAVEAMAEELAKIDPKYLGKKA
jgi:hypothetical protein